jgi:hypothetical protein
MTSPAEDLEGIRHTLATYNVSGDRLKLEALAGAFLPDGILETGTQTMRGRAEIINGLGVGRGKDATNVGARPTFVRHNLTTQHLELTGPDTANGRSYFIVFTDIGPDHMGYYVDNLRKVDGKWYIEHRRVQLDWMAENTLFGSNVEHYKATRDALKARRTAAAS